MSIPAGSGRRRALALYRHLLRLHQKLPTDMRNVGTLFVRDEFKKHRGVPEDQAQLFIKEWTTFAHTLEMQMKSPGKSEMGERISPKDVELMNEGQLLQMNELYNETTKPRETRDHYIYETLQTLFHSKIHKSKNLAT